MDEFEVISSPSVLKLMSFVGTYTPKVRQEFILTPSPETSSHCVYLFVYWRYVRRWAFATPRPHQTPSAYLRTNCHSHCVWGDPGPGIVSVAALCPSLRQLPHLHPVPLYRITLLIVDCRVLHAMPLNNEYTHIFCFMTQYGRIRIIHFGHHTINFLLKQSYV